MWEVKRLMNTKQKKNNNTYSTECKNNWRCFLSISRDHKTASE